MGLGNLLFMLRMVMAQAVVKLVEVRSSFVTVVGMAAPPGKPRLGRFPPVRPISRNTYVDFRVNMASSVES